MFWSYKLWNRSADKRLISGRAHRVVNIRNLVNLVRKIRWSNGLFDIDCMSNMGIVDQLVVGVIIIMSFTSAGGKIKLNETKAGEYI